MCLLPIHILPCLICTLQEWTAYIFKNSTSDVEYKEFSQAFMHMSSTTSKTQPCPFSQEFLRMPFAANLPCAKPATNLSLLLAL